MDGGVRRELGFYARKDRRNELWFRIGVLGGAIALALLIVLALLLNGLWLLILIPGVVYIIIRLSQKPDYHKIARRIEAGFPGLRGKVVNALELSEYGATGKERYSSDLIGAVIAEGIEGLQNNPIANLIDRRKTKFAFLGFACACALLCSYALVLPSRFSLGLYTAFSPSRTPIQLTVEPGNIAVSKGSPVEVRLTVASPYPLHGALFVKTGDAGKPVKIRIPLRNGRAAVAETVAAGFDYYFKVFNRRSPVFRVGVQKPLEITSLTFIYHYPAYSKLPPFTTGSDEIYSLAGTRVEIRGSCDENIHSGSLVFSDSSRIGVATADKNFSSEFTVDRRTEFSITLRDRAGNENEPTTIRVSPVADEPPVVRLFDPGRDTDMPVSMKVLLGVNSLDDYGLGELWLCYEKNGSPGRIRLKAVGGRTEDTTFYYWDLSGIGLAPGEAVSYYATVADNDVIRGPKSGRSETFRVRFPTVDEIYRDVVSRTSEVKEKLEPISAAQDTLGAMAERVEDRLKADRQLDWSDKKNIENLLAHQDELLGNIDALKREVTKALENLQQGMLLDRESLDKLRDIDNLLSEILPDDVKRALDNLRRSLEKDYPKVKDAVANWKLSQEALKKAIDRALELLTRAAQEERLKTIARQADALHKLQREIQTNFDKEAGSKLAQWENQVKEGLEGVKQDAEGLAREMKDEDVARALAELAQEMAKKGLAEQAGRLAGQMQSGGKGQAKAGGQQLLQSLADLKAKLSALTDQLADERSKEVARKLTAAAKDILALSQEQERLEGAVDRGDDMVKLAQAEQALAAGTRTVAESIYALSRLSMAVSPQIGSEMVKAMVAMDEAKQSLARSTGLVVKAPLVRARNHLDQATGAVLNALNQNCQGGCMSGAGGLEQMLAQLSQLSLAQMMLNQESGSIFPIPMGGGGMSQAQMARIQRILSQQSKIRSELEGLSRSLGEKPGLLGTLDKIVDEMKRVEKDLASLAISRETLERQEQVLTRLLDAQKSVRQREFSKKRESETGRETGERPVPLALPADKGERRKRLREELLRAMKEGYPREYEALIRAYFEALVGE